jgi:hypothetical protein
VTSVASLVFHCSVEDWPRWIEVGSAERVAVGALGGGGGIGFSFFLHPLTNVNAISAPRIKLQFLVR